MAASKSMTGVMKEKGCGLLLNLNFFFCYNDYILQNAACEDRCKDNIE